MHVGQIFDVLMAIVSVAGTTVIVTSPRLADIITSFGNAFSNSLKAAMGR
jgi:arginine exporter protein ArgO